MLLAVIIDSDAWSGGVPNVGVTKVTEYLRSIKDTVGDEAALDQKMIDWAVKETKHPANLTA